MYPIDGKVDITLSEMLKHFTKWNEAWKHSNDEDYAGKYKYIYMGFGNGLSVDNSIYSEYEPYLNELTAKYLEDKSEGEKRNS